MTCAVIWVPDARADYDEVLLLFENEEAALALVDRVENAEARLADFPESAPVREEAHQRVLVLKPYCLGYRYKSIGVIEIVSFTYGLPWRTP